MKLRQGLIECYKTLINDVCTMEGVWQGKLAKFFETCKKSDDKEVDEVNIEFNTWEWYAKQEHILWYGTVDPTSVVFCYDLPFIAKTPSPSSIYAKSVYTTLGSYFWENYSAAGGITLPTVISALL